MATIFKSSIGKKLVQSISGLFLILFLLLHGTINFFSVLDSIFGRYGSVAVDETLFSTGDGWFKLGCDFMSTPVISIMVPVLALGFLIHIAWGIWLEIGNIKSRGGLKRYEVASKAKTDSWASKNMLVLGVIVLGFIGFHLTHFWAKMQLPEMFGVGNYEDDPYLLLNVTFQNWWVVVLYIIWFCALGFHLTHGFWSAFQTIGWNNQIWIKRLKFLSAVVAVVIVLMFTTVAINACLHANGILA